MTDVQALLVPSHTPGLGGELDQVIIRLTEFPEDSPQYLLSHLLGYWGRERRADLTEKFRLLSAEAPSLLDNPDTLGALHLVRREPPPTARSLPLAIFSFPEQETGRDLLHASRVVLQSATNDRAIASVHSVDPRAREITLKWTTQLETKKFIPVALTFDDWVNPAPKPEALLNLARTLLDTPDDVSPLALALLRADSPRLSSWPAQGLSGDVDKLTDWVGEIDHSYVPVQGPPGTGKTYVGAHAVYELVKAGRRVGLSAVSHSAIDNLLRAVHELFRENDELDELRVARKVNGRPPRRPLERVTYLNHATQCASPAFNVIAGTTWLFASPEMRGALDVLVIDEAGQLSLADALSVTGAATSSILLGDPQQLAQVSLGSHPEGSGASMLEHVLDTPVVSADRGIFLATSRRLHPELATYISQNFYEDALLAHPPCALQRVDHEPVALKTLPVAHLTNTRESPEEATAIRDEIVSLLGRHWSDQDGGTQPLEAKDFMVVAPYNDQVDLLRALLAEDPRTAEVEVGTVDKFQGREAPVVFFSLTSSTRSRSPRGTTFLFSPNRLNVAISRAQCLAYLVYNPALLDDPTIPADEALLAPFRDFVARAAG